MRAFTVILSLLVSNQCFAAHLTEQERLKILEDHNNARRTLATPVANNMLKLEWDPILAEVASQFADRCDKNNFAHNQNTKEEYAALGGAHAEETGGSVGENWYGGDPTNYTDSYFGGAVAQWTSGRCNGLAWEDDKITCTSYHCSEMDNFYATETVGGKQCTQTSFGDIGHFTQVMWAKTRYVGCGYSSTCATTCNYAQAGNYNVPEGTTLPSYIWGVGGDAASNCPLFAPYNDDGLCSAYAKGSNPPTVEPSYTPTVETSDAPSVDPTYFPTPTEATCPSHCTCSCPSEPPTAEPTPIPTVTASDEPTTETPTEVTTEAPSAEPSTEAPSEAPSETPSEAPSETPSEVPATEAAPTEEVVETEAPPTTEPPTTDQPTSEASSSTEP